MNRLSEAWFEFKGTLSAIMGITIVEMPKRGVPYMRGKHVTVSGRDGTVFVSDNTYENVEVSLTFDVRNRQYVPQVDAWLSGSGLLRFSDEPYMAYEARISKTFSRKNISKHLDGQRYTVTFTCAPFKYAYPLPDAIVISTSGTSIVNPGTAPAKPRVKITGNGTFSVTIGSETLYFEGVSDGGIIVDSSLMDALTYDGTALANDKVSGQPWQLLPGSLTVSWDYDPEAVDEATGEPQNNSVSSVEILPRWRWH